MALATVDDEGLPDVRMVLLKDVDERGFVFYTNSRSAKGLQLAAHPKAALLFHWKSLRRQVRVRGTVEPGQRRRGRRLFRQPRPFQPDRRLGLGPVPADARAACAWKRRVAAMGLKFGLGAVPRPPHWTGYRLAPRASSSGATARSACTNASPSTATRSRWTVEPVVPLNGSTEDPDLAAGSAGSPAKRTG